MSTTTRSSNWSITINNPTKDDVKCVLPGWKLEGQYEEGQVDGTTHFQGYLKTPQVRFSAVKAAFPRAHIEIARDVSALKKYVHKEETRVGEFNAVSTPNIFQLQSTVADLWNDEEYMTILNSMDDKFKADAPLRYVDKLVTQLIRAGVNGIEFTAINPMWRSSWKNFSAAIIARSRQTDRQTEEVDIAVAEYKQHERDTLPASPEEELSAFIKSRRASPFLSPDLKSDERSDSP